MIVNIRGLSLKFYLICFVFLATIVINNSSLFSQTKNLDVKYRRGVNKTNINNPSSDKTLKIPLDGKGIVNDDIIQRVEPKAIYLSSEDNNIQVDIDKETAIEIATNRARWEWGNQVKFGSITPIFNLSGEIVAYDVDFTIDGSVFGSYEQVVQ